MRIEIDDLSRHEVHAMLQEHLDNMSELSPPESGHALLRRRGAGRAVLARIVAEAESGGYRRLSLETGSMDAFKLAQDLYTSFGFTHCGPFADYSDDPNSVFMTLELSRPP